MKKPEIRLPKALDAITDVVLAYRPKPKTPSSKKRNEKIAQMAREHHQDDFRIEESSGNVFADLGLPNAKERLEKAEAEFAIQHRLKAKPG